jgi:hypothetical protein
MIPDKGESIGMKGVSQLDFACFLSLSISSSTIIMLALLEILPLTLAEDQELGCLQP